jgi:ABC-type lipoprotein export system ATPase subunit
MPTSARLSAHGISVLRTETVAGYLGQLSRGAPTLSLWFYLFAGALALVLAFGVVLLGAFVGSEARVYEYAALKVAGVQPRLLRQALMREYRSTLGLSMLIGSRPARRRCADAAGHPLVSVGGSVGDVPYSHRWSPTDRDRDLSILAMSMVVLLALRCLREAHAGASARERDESGRLVSRSGLYLPARGYDVVALATSTSTSRRASRWRCSGPSGSGKSTLPVAARRPLTPSAGRLTVGEHDVAKASETELQAMRASDVGVVLQGAARNLLPYLSVEQNVRFAQRSVVGEARRALPPPREVLSIVGLAVRSRYRARPGQLSPAERQRLALAVALACRPGLLLADEPTSQLDSRSRTRLSLR